MKKCIRRSRNLFVKKGDTVMVISGDDKGKKGIVLTVYVKKDKILIEGVNMVKKSAKITEHNTENFKTEERPIDVSNVKLITR